METILNYLGSNFNNLYLFSIHIILVISAVAISRAIFHRFKLVPIYRSYLGYFWLSAGFFWLTNILQSFLLLNNYQAAFYLSYLKIILVIIQGIILGTYFLSIVFDYYRFSPIIFFITLLYGAIGGFLLFIQKNLFILYKDEWLHQYVINPNLFIYMFCAIVCPLALLMLIYLGKIVYYIIKKRYHPLHRLNIYMDFILLSYAALFSLYYSHMIKSWYSIIILLLIIIPLLFTYLLLIKDTYYQEVIINPNNNLSKVVKIPLLFKFIIGNLIALVIPLGLANGILYIIYQKIDFASTISTDINLYAHLTIINSFIIILGLAANAILTKKSIYRLESLMKGTQEIQKENWNYQIPVEGSDEITALTISFNDMIKNLKSYKNELKNYSIILEEEIDKRTRELREKRKEAEMLADENMTLYKQLQQETNTIIDNIADSLIAIDNHNKIMTVNKVFIEKFNITNNVLGKSFDSLDFVDEYKLMKIVKMFRKEGLKKYNFRLNLTQPYYGVLQCYMTRIDLDDNKHGIMFLLQDTTPPWGTVLSSENYEPINLAIVRLFDNSNNKLVETAVTDDNGRFGFFVKPGQYYITVEKENYHFPSQKRAGYHGEIINVKSKEEGIIKVNILMDPSKQTRSGIKTGEEKREEGVILQNDFITPLKEDSKQKQSSQQPSASLTQAIQPKGDDNEEKQEKTNSSLSQTTQIEKNLKKDKNEKPKQEKNMDPQTEMPEIKKETPTQPTRSKHSEATVLSDRARKAKEAKKAREGNTNIEEKPRAMLKKIEHMIEEEKKIKGKKNGNGLDVSQTLEE